MWPRAEGCSAPTECLVAALRRGAMKDGLDLRPHSIYVLGAGLLLIPAICLGVSSLANLCGFPCRAEFFVAAVFLGSGWQWITALPGSRRWVVLVATVATTAAAIGTTATTKKRSSSGIDRRRSAPP